jgi:hypothetical protein
MMVVVCNAGPLIALGLLSQAYYSGILSLPQVELLIQDIAARPDIWIGTRLCEQVLQALRAS